MMFPPEGRRDGNEIIEPRVPFEDIPLSAIRQKTSNKLSSLLNVEKALLTECGYQRDWRGIFALSGLNTSEFSLISQSQDKTHKLLDLWIKSNNDKENIVTVKHFQDCLETIDRYDVQDDIFELLAEDAKAFLSSPKVKDTANGSGFEIVKSDFDKEVVTVQDIKCKEQGLPLQTFDALVIYHDNDVEFASELVEKCEERGFSLCVKDRDLLAGISFESEAMLNLLSERCNRLVVVVSKAFLNSPMQVYITNFAQTLGIEQGKRKIIPCLVEQCELPQMLRYSFRLDYWKNNKLFNFWDKLDQSMRETTRLRNSLPERESISEIDAASINLKVNIPTTPGPLYDKEQIYKFTETPTSDDKQEKSFLEAKTSPEASKLIWPPPPKLRSSSSMLNLNDTKSESTIISNKLSQSSFYLNEDPESVAGFEAIKSKKNKWFKKFLSPSRKVSQESAIAEQPEIPELERKRPWDMFKIKKKKKKSKHERIAVACES